MGRNKKISEPKRKNKKSEEEEEDLVESEEEVEERKKENTRSRQPKTNKPKKSKDDDDELSELDIEDDESVPVESNQNDEVVFNKKSDVIKHQIIDPKTPIGNLKNVEILSYLIKVGIDTANPILKDGAVNLKRLITGKKERYYNNGSKSYGRNSGSKSYHNYQGYQRNYNHAGNYPRNPQMNRQGPPTRGPRTTHTSGDIYGDTE